MTATPPPSGSRMVLSWQLCAGSNNRSLNPEIRDLLWQLLTWGAYYLSCDTETWKLPPYLLFQNHSSKMGGSPIAFFLPTWLHLERQFSHKCTWLVEPKLHALFFFREVIEPLALKPLSERKAHCKWLEEMFIKPIAEFTTNHYSLSRKWLASLTLTHWDQSFMMQNRSN